MSDIKCSSGYKKRFSKVVFYGLHGFCGRETSLIVLLKQ